MANLTKHQPTLIQSEYEQSYYIIAEENVMAHGAHGDGVADDTAAFLSAIAATAAKGGGTVFIPAGRYRLTATLTLPCSVALVGELERGTAKGTVLCICHGKGETDPDHAAIILNHQSSVQSVAFWYPEQRMENGTFAPYPSTLTQRGSESVTVRNITFVNAYFGINYGTLGGGQGSNSLEYTRDIFGTCLHLGYHNDPSYDIGKLENFHFSPDYWLDSGLPDLPDADALRAWMLKNSTGILLQRIDWTYIADIYVEGYYKGIHTSLSSTGTPNGHMYHIHLLDCYYPYYAEELSWTIASDCHFRAVGGGDAAALYLSEKCKGDMVFVDSVFESAGAHAIVNRGESKLSLTGCTVTSVDKAFVNQNCVATALINTVFSDGCDDGVITDARALTLPPTPHYGKTVVTKPASERLIVLSEAPYGAVAGEDVTAVLQRAIDDLKETGGTVYLPAGAYTLSGHIDVWAGIEVRGVAIWAQNFGATHFITAYGQGDPDGEALFTLYDGAGLRGLSVIYDHKDPEHLLEYAYTVRGKGKNIYLVDVCIPSAWNGVDFATYRCDAHYIEYLWGAFLNVGIRVGAGSENGIIRDCHFTPNCWRCTTAGSWWGAAYNAIMNHGTPYVIGESRNEILYHNFTYGAYQGLTVLDGAENVYVLSHGVDSGDISSYFSGNCTVNMVNAELVNLDVRRPNYLPVHGNYVYTETDFSGTVNFISVAGWGPSVGAFRFGGGGTVNITGAKICNAGMPMLQLDAGSANILGLINDTDTVDYCAGQSAVSLHIAGNLYASKLRLDDSVKNGSLTLSGTDAAAYV
ncbi:MAG: hypothetical protein IJW40_09970 [Clostridia bacterium]|nr:hypothetical protein [Clostridia bacterium]